jgi:hypothetical protein
MSHRGGRPRSPWPATLRRGFPDPDRRQPVFTAWIPADVLEGQPLRYQRQGNSYLIYSVGRQGKDEMSM